LDVWAENTISFLEELTTSLKPRLDSIAAEFAKNKSPGCLSNANVVTSSVMSKMDESTQRAYRDATALADQTLQKIALTADEREHARRMGEQIVAQVVEYMQFALAESKQDVAAGTDDYSKPLRRSLCFPAAVAFALSAINEFARTMDQRFRTLDD
jgi:hypothetical protein